MSEKIKSLIKRQFVAMSAKVDHCIDERWIMHQLRPSLNPKELTEIDAAIAELRNEGIILVDRRAGMLALALTQKGFDEIYPANPAAASKIRNLILGRFRDTSSKVGHCVDSRWIMHGLMPALNPREQGELDRAVQGMVDDGLIEVQEMRGMNALFLTQKGFDSIY